MACGAAHEINNPLAIISGRAQQLAAGETEPARRDIFKTIIQQADRISDIIAELQQFAQPAAPALRAVDPLALARQVAAEFEPKPGQPGAAVHVEAAEPVPTIRVDPSQVAGALKEVLRNAVEACPNGSGGRVQVAVQPVRAEQAVRFVVTDTGPGMEPNVRARAFDPFFCGREAGRHRGLGLPKAYRAVQANGGEMSLESTPGRGTTVRMTFRAAEAIPAA
jgi:signal transduction histidine kinase